MLEDLLEQEKREKQERERQASMNNEMNNPNSSSLLSDHDFERLRADVLGAQGMPTQGIPAQGLLPIPQQQQQQAPQQPQMVQNQPPQQQQQQRQQTFVPQNTPRPQFIQRSVSQPHQTPQQHMQNQVQDMNVVGMDQNVGKKDVVNMPMFVPNLQKAPTQPPDCIVTEQDRQMQIQYEQWLTNKDNELVNHQKYLQDKVEKLRKSRRALNSKQRTLKKGGNDLTESDTIELSKITTEQSFIQKQLENARKQSRQHTLVINDYKNKQQAVSIKSNLARQQMAVRLFTVDQKNKY